MIPKIIHYCWLSNDPIPQSLLDCMHSWKEKLPDYTWLKWDLQRFDINSSVWVKEAFEAKKYAFAADYIRLYAIYTMGGVYLDMDIKVLKPLDDFLDNDFFTFNEYYPRRFKELNNESLLDAQGHRIREGKIAFGLQAAILGGEKGSSFVKELMGYYEDRHFLLQDGSLDTQIIAPTIYVRIAEKYGFVYRDVKQDLGNRVTIYPSYYVAATGDMISNSNYAIHYCAHSWASTIHMPVWKRLWIKSQIIINKIFHRQ